MLRMQISLTAEARRRLDEEAERTGRSISALIRDAVSMVYGSRRDTDADLRAIESGFGAWSGHEASGGEYVERLRSGRRLDDVVQR